MATVRLTMAQALVRYLVAQRIATEDGSEPLFGALFAVLWLSEELSLQAWIGGLLIVAATLWTSLARR